ncbi:protein kinase [Stigmatella sp. ncwal1]|uniref:Protein kinase n=1 Tax=Stigmatella ashevillensis TaxID=2995309 RepID=A0ABT5DGD9_9BACT|nr:protein kinase [Stigmatella ashevillena]MDC0712735.1 protein kinase [Stigmatella ashevillena]
MTSNDEAPEEYVEHFKRHNLSIGRRIGSGASGSVYRANQPKLGRDLAIKLFDHTSGKSDTLSRKRFEREARLLAKAQHPSIPFVLSCGDVPCSSGNSTPYIIMQLIEGNRLDAIIAKERSTPKTAIFYMKQILAALACAHQHNIIHRDVKPENILVSNAGSGHCYLIDFSVGVSLVSTPGLTRVTGDKRPPGTWLYAAPEQLEGKEVDQRADLFSAGLVLFELLTGRRITKPELSEVELSLLSPSLKPLLQKACHPNLPQRFQSANDFRAELERLEFAGISLEFAGINRVTSRDALCLNFRCPGTRWGMKGWYEGPNIIIDTTKSFCKDCGNSLVYPCAHCGAPFSDSQYCPDCGHTHYEKPFCEKCFTILNKRDRYTNTVKNGCASCKADDDIPF